MTERDARGELLVVGTPIGNLDDFSPRAREALRSADAIFCEDTRVTAKLAARFGLTAPRISCPGPRETVRVEELRRRLARGESVALVTDAGMPGLSDPGERLVAAAAEAGHAVRVIPGPSAPAAALAVSGLPAVPHLFVGFLPARAGERRRALEALRDRIETLVWFETPHRIAESLADAARILGPRRAALARELTKRHEEVLRGTLDALAQGCGAAGLRGEMTLVVEGADPDGRRAAADPGDVEARIRGALADGRDKREIARSLARETGLPAREIYARAVRIANETEPRG